MPFFWFWSQPSVVSYVEDWIEFRAQAWGLILIVTAIGAMVMVATYYLTIRRKKIRSAADPFRLPSRPWWLFWGLSGAGPGFVGGVAYWIAFTRKFDVTSLAPFWGALTAGFFCWVIAAFAFQVLIWIPGITPRKFLYHPRWPWRMLSGRPRLR